MRVGVVGRCPDVPGAPTAFAPGGNVWVDAVIGRVAGTGNATVMDPVENPRRFLRIWIAAEGGLPGNETRLYVVTAGIGSGNQLVGAAIEQQSGTGLLANMGVGAGIFDFVLECEGGESVVGGGSAYAGLVGRDGTVVVERAGQKASHMLRFDGL